MGLPQPLIRGKRRTRLTAERERDLYACGDLHALAWRFGEASEDFDLVRGIALAMRRDTEPAGAVHEALVQPEPACGYVPNMLLGMVFARPLLEQRVTDTDYLQQYVDNAVLPLLLHA